jgi:uncharacterized protein YbgA (DUF1722 family)
VWLYLQEPFPQFRHGEGPGLQRIPEKKGVGMFARIFMEHFPLLPVEEDGRLHDIRLRENFIERIFALKRWRDLLDEKKSRGRLVAFHTQHKLLILSHGQKHSRILGKLVAAAKSISPKQLYPQYQALFMEALKLKTTVKKNINVLQHMMGYFKKQLSADEKHELLETFIRSIPGRLYPPYRAPYSDQTLCAQIRPALPEPAGLPEPTPGGAQAQKSCLRIVWSLAHAMSRL